MDEEKEERNESFRSHSGPFPEDQEFRIRDEILKLQQARIEAFRALRGSIL